VSLSSVIWHFHKGSDASLEGNHGPGNLSPDLWLISPVRRLLILGLAPAPMLDLRVWVLPLTLPTWLIYKLACCFS